jgi:uncharacterized protein YecE (DUF72 family)
VGVDLRIGISGWRYTPWRGDFYPEGLVQKRELEFASRAVNSIEINGSFYALQKPASYATWYANTPDDFIFSVKAPRFITHVKRLRDIEEPLANFFASGVFQLKEKLGPFLWQFPPNFKFDPDLFRNFFKQLPHTGKAAKACARHCSERMVTEGYLDIPLKQTLRHAIEIRNATFVTLEFIQLLREFKIALVFADTAGKWSYAEDITSDFIYIRFHGDKELYTSGYDEAALEHWYQRIKTWSNGKQPGDSPLIAQNAQKINTSRDTASVKTRNVYCYFDNDVKVRAPYDARRLLEKFNLAGNLAAEPGKMMESKTTYKNSIEAKTSENPRTTKESKRTTKEQQKKKSKANERK